MAQVAVPGYGAGHARQSSFDRPHSINQEEEEVVVIKCAAVPSLHDLQLLLPWSASQEGGPGTRGWRWRVQQAVSGRRGGRGAGGPHQLPGCDRPRLRHCPPAPGLWAAHHGRQAPLPSMRIITLPPMGPGPLQGRKHAAARRGWRVVCMAGCGQGTSARTGAGAS